MVPAWAREWDLVLLGGKGVGPLGRQTTNNLGLLRPNMLVWNFPTRGSMASLWIFVTRVNVGKLVGRMDFSYYKLI